MKTISLTIKPRAGWCGLVLGMLVWGGAAVGAEVGANDVSSSEETYVGDVTRPVQPREKLERALNGTFGFPAVPERFAVKWEADERGFAKGRLFSVPEVGVHPRILFGPGDVGRIRKEMMENEAGRAMWEAIKGQLDKGVNDPTTWEGKCFAALAAGDLEAFRAAYVESPMDNVPPGSGFRSNVTGRNPVTKWGPRNPLLVSMQAKALVALIEDDEAAGKRVANALSTYADVIGPRVEAANKKDRAEFQWGSTRDFVDREIAYSYDWAWKWMTPEQREKIRRLIVSAVIGKYTVGMDLPPHWRNWNHLGMTEGFVACLFAIEGTEGDDPRALARMYEVYQDYLTYGINTMGSGTEGVGYQTLGIGHLSSPMVAFANRGKNLFVHPHYRRHTESWLVQSMMPFGGAWMSDGDLGNFAPSLWMLAVQKYYFPESAGIDFVLKNHPLVSKKEWARIAADAVEVQWILPLLLDETDRRAKAQEEAAAVAGGGLSFFDQPRGTLYTRTGWGEDDVKLHVDCRSDTTYANHEHPDRGQFVLAAHGRVWAADGYRDTESKFHNVVTINGRGQGYFATPGKWVHYADEGTHVTATIDAKYCYDWKWMKSTFTESRASLENRGQSVFAPSAEQLQKRFPVTLWEPDPTVKDYYEGFAKRDMGDPRMWDDEDGWVLRTKWYPVQKAFRSVVLWRGKQPYVLVVDDIRRDDAENHYEWRMNMPPDVSAVSISAADILLGDLTTARKAEGFELNGAFQGRSNLTPTKGDRLLLVRTLEVGMPELPTYQPVPMVATVEYKKTDDVHQFTGRSMGMGTQVVIGSRSVEPRFVVMLYPHLQGQPIPKTSWNEDKTLLTVQWPDGAETWQFKTTPEGRREVRLVR